MVPTHDDGCPTPWRAPNGCTPADAGVETGPMSWFVHAVPLPDGDRPVDLWVDRGGCLVRELVAGAEQLPGHYVVPGLVDAHAHPMVAGTPSGPVAVDGAEALDVLARWAASGVCLVRDAGSPGGSVLGLDLVPGMPRLTELALAELARGGRWVKIIADFPPVVDGVPSGPAEPTYSGQAIEAMVAA